MFRGPEGFCLKITNIESSDRNCASLRDFNLTIAGDFVPRATLAFVTYSKFPENFEGFKHFVVTQLKLPRLADPQIFMFCTFWNEFRLLDGARYVAVKTCLEMNGRPGLASHRKIYVVCDWAQVHRLVIVCTYYICANYFVVASFERILKTDRGASKSVWTTKEDVMLQLKLNFL